MAFRSTASRSIQFSLRFNGLLSRKIEVEELMRRDFGVQYKQKLSSLLTSNDEYVEAEVVAGPHVGDGKHPLSSQDDRLHSTYRVYVRDKNGVKRFVRAIHIVHDPKDYEKALEKVKILNQLAHESAQESERKRKAEEAEEAKLAAEAKQEGAAAVPKA